MFIDTHAHLDFPEFKHEVSAILGRAREARVEKIINIGVDLASSKQSYEMARRYPEIFATIGFHPEASLNLDIETMGRLTALAQAEKVVAIGEIGLDYYHLKRASKFARYPSREEQMFCFEQMLDLALEVKLPVVVHCRESEADVLAILKSYSGSLTGVVHCFSGDWDFAEKILDLGFAISFTGNITYKNSSPATLSAIKRIPLGSIMIETDSPFLAPGDHRGDRNEPAFVVEVAKTIAELKGISLAEVEESTTKKANKFFRLEGRR